eukprot:Seg1756.13 transcript_id=Seg1756.13/GoldUCD/mRNA.D3Y31 product=Catalase protein_id=Seg1756.13/GoldUCD/D3Y31
MFFGILRLQAECNSESESRIPIIPSKAIHNFEDQISGLLRRHEQSLSKIDILINKVIQDDDISMGTGKFGREKPLLILEKEQEKLSAIVSSIVVLYRNKLVELKKAIINELTLLDKETSFGLRDGLETDVPERTCSYQQYQERISVQALYRILLFLSGTPLDTKTQTMTVGPRGPVLIQDHGFIDDMAHFDRERIPERVVHAKGAGAFGVLKITHDITKYCKAAPFECIGKETPCALRFSTVGGESGSADTARDPRGFAMKFYTEAGNWDLDRVIDASLKRQIENRSIRICELHFTQDQINNHRTRKTLKPGVLPTLRLPVKSVVTGSGNLKPRESAKKIGEKKALHQIDSTVKSVCYKSFSEFCLRAKKSKLPDKWRISAEEADFVKIAKEDEVHELPITEIYIDDSLGFTVRVFGSSGRLMWNDEQFIVWSHITKFVKEDLDCGLRLLPKLTNEHIKLTPFSRMNVKLAVQVLSSSVAEILKSFGPQDAKGTAQFCNMFESFFDCMNIRNTVEHKLKCKPFLKPFESVDDERLSWLTEVFLQYFKDWQQSIENRPGDFSKDAKAKMFLSRQTYEGVQMTVHSTVELVKFLLSRNVKYVLTERFCQDPLENYFGRQRGMGRRKDNPSLRDVGFNDNTIRMSRMVKPIQGNCRGAFDAKDEIDFGAEMEKLPCRKAKRKKC